MNFGLGIAIKLRRLACSFLGHQWKPVPMAGYYECERCPSLAHTIMCDDFGRWFNAETGR